MVNCNICLIWECRLDNLASHVKKNHPGSWKKGANRNQFVFKAAATPSEASSAKNDSCEEVKESAEGSADEVLGVADVIAGCFI